MSTQNFEAFLLDFYSSTDVSSDNRERIYKNSVGIELERSYLDKAVRISSIRSFNRGEGDGSAALDWLCALADKHRVRLIGEPVPYDTRIRDDRSHKSSLNREQLMGWYKRHGFEVSLLQITREPK